MALAIRECTIWRADPCLALAKVTLARHWRLMSFPGSESVLLYCLSMLATTGRPHLT
jgi:hypothetical protein